MHIGKTDGPAYRCFSVGAPGSSRASFWNATLGLPRWSVAFPRETGFVQPRERLRLGEPSLPQTSIRRHISDALMPPKAEQFLSMISTRFSNGSMMCRIPPHAASGSRRLRVG